MVAPVKIIFVSDVVDVSSERYLSSKSRGYVSESVEQRTLIYFAPMLCAVPIRIVLCRLTQCTAV